MGGGPSQEDFDTLKSQLNANQKLQQTFEREREDNKKALENFQNIHQKKLTQLEQRHSQEVAQNTQRLSELKQQQQRDKAAYNDQIDRQKKKQDALESQLLAVQQSSEEQKKQFEEKEKKIKQQLEKKINNLKAENIKSQKEYDKKMQKIKASNDAKLEKLQKNRDEDMKKYTQQMNDLAKKNEQDIKKLEQNGLKNRINQTEQLIKARIAEYKSKKKETKHVFNQYLKDLTQIALEERRLKRVFSAERADPNLLNIVLLGITGHGKSTLACRLVGDKSNKCDSGYFKHSNNLVSVTQGIKKKVCKGVWKKDISVVDTPGIFDSGGNDRHHANNLVEFLRGCGGVNAFILVKTKIPPRFDASFQNVLNTLEVMLGRQFWHHAILMITHQNAAESKSNDFKNLGDKLRGLIRQQCNLKDDEGDLPCLGVDSFKNYKKPIKDLIKIIPTKRFECTKLRSPLQDLKIKNKNTKDEYNAKKTDLDSIKFVINRAYEQYVKTDKVLKGKDKSYQSHKIDLSAIEDEKGEWDETIELPPEEPNELPTEEHKEHKDNYDDDEKVLEEPRKQWSEEYVVVTKKYELVALEDDEVSLKLQDDECKPPDEPVKLNKNDDKYDKFLETIQDAEDDGEDCIVTVQKLHLKNVSGQQKINMKVVSIKKGDDDDDDDTELKKDNPLTDFKINNGGPYNLEFKDGSNWPFSSVISGSTTSNTKSSVSFVIAGEYKYGEEEAISFGVSLNASGTLFVCVVRGEYSKAISSLQQGQQSLSGSGWTASITPKTVTKNKKYSVDIVIQASK